jgi:hypothetical protein
MMGAGCVADSQAAIGALIWHQELVHEATARASSRHEVRASAYSLDGTAKLSKLRGPRRILTPQCILTPNSTDTQLTPDRYATDT